MFFTAKIENWNSDKLETDTVIVSAENYTEAVEKIEGVYREDLKSIQIEAITDCDLLFVDDTAIDIIKDIPYNEFF